MPDIMLCTDSTSARYPECLGLDGEPLFAQNWLDVQSSASQARMRAAEGCLKEAWVTGSDDVDAINLAAVLKRDASSTKVCLVAFKGNGSLLSRAQAAGVDEVWDKPTFLQHYHHAKGEKAHPSSVVSVLPDPLQEPVSALDASSESKQACASQSAGPQALQAGRGYVLGVVGAGGGVGKSSIAVVSAYLAQSKGYRTALVDADLQFGDIQYLTGREDALALDEALSTPSKLEALECSGRHPAILSAPARLEYSEEVASQIPELIERVRERFDVVVVNTSPTWTDIHLQLLESGGNTVFVLDQRPSSIRACKHALSLCARCGVATQPIVFALNRCSRSSLFSSIDVTCALKGAHVVELAEGGRDVEELLGTGAPVELIDSGNPLCQSVARMLADLLPTQAVHEPPKVVMPSRRRFRFISRRKRAACL